MRKIILTPFVCSALLLTACSSEGESDNKASGKVTQTRMDDIDKIEGTINDDMINVDESTDSAALAKDDGSSDAAANSDASADAEPANSPEIKEGPEE